MRMNTRRAAVFGGDEKILLSAPDGFAFSVSRFSANALRCARHAFELEPAPCVYIRADSAVDALHPWDAGENDCLRIPLCCQSFYPG